MIEEDIILFDGHCHMCSGITRFLQNRLSKLSKVKFVGLQSVEGVNIHSNLPLKIKNADSLILIRDGIPYIRSAAGIRTLLYLNRKWSWMFIFAWIIPLPIRDLMYILVSKIRYMISKKNKCDIH